MVPYYSSELLEVAEFCELLEQTHKLFKTLFLVALSTGNRVSELAALCRTAALFLANKAIISVKRGFLFKNQTAAHNSPNVSLPNILEKESLFPVIALKQYLYLTRNLPQRGYGFLNPGSGSSLTAVTLFLCEAIKLLVHCSKVRAQYIRKFSFS